MWCKYCSLETNEPYCPICDSKTEDDVAITIGVKNAKFRSFILLRRQILASVRFVGIRPITCPLIYDRFFRKNDYSSLYYSKKNRMNI